MVAYGAWQQRRAGGTSTARAFSDKDAQAWNARVKATNPLVKALPVDHEIPGVPKKSTRQSKKRVKKPKTASVNAEALDIS